ncbi:MAG: UDP-N-acetylglucosamine 4,6-dehydratase [Chlamydiales bacterium]|jgi:UDP-N-acetylglucosamine 4,6-dehydratase
MSNEILSPLDGKTILITGGTGSFGKTFARKALEEHNPNKVIIFSRDEWKQWQMRRSEPIFDHENIRYFLGDVRDKDRLMRAFRDVDLVVHAAALKQVPSAEYNPSEFVKTNIEGAMNVIDAAVDRGVEKVIALSTDKAVNPINLYGATKLCSDKLFVAGNIYVGNRTFPKFSVVRYGNVLGSRGSIIPLWNQMVAEKAPSLTITDSRMTRFWITLDQAAEFVVRSFADMCGGEIFVPKIPSMNITDLAEAIAPGYPTSICGIREGEKLHELMISADDSRHTFEFDRCYVIVPEVFRKDRLILTSFFLKNEGKPVPDGFVYASDTNSLWLNAEKLRETLKGEFAIEASY